MIVVYLVSNLYCLRYQHESEAINPDSLEQLLGKLYAIIGTVFRAAWVTAYIYMILNVTSTRVGFRRQDSDAARMYN